MNTTCELDACMAELDAELARMKSLEHNFWLATTIVKTDDDRTGATEIARLILDSQSRILDLLDKLIDDGKIGRIKATHIINELDKEARAVVNTLVS